MDEAFKIFLERYEYILRQDPYYPIAEGVHYKDWENWFDESILALKNKTPREAATTKEGGERLESLFLYDQRNDLERDSNPFKADILYLKRELGIDS
jgi:hypothetical protein